ncbi:MAG: replication-associated recombination protein A [Nitrospirae bacterium]|nr:replication-associated recombination protein A [Nitrospirota bacterium]
MQPEDFEDFLGQSHLLDRNKPLRRLIEDDKIVSVIFYGPPGTGKTALAHIIARKTKARFISINAVTAGIKDIREAVDSSRGQRAILFVDEIHRFNKTQQDALLPHVEKGEIILVGASTQNPFFSLVPALSSRSLIFPFRHLPAEELKKLLYRAISDKKGLGEYEISLQEEAAEYIASVSEGDARKSLNILELSFLSSLGSGTGPEDFSGDGAIHRAAITLAQVKEVTQNRSIYYDEDEHYNTISAFIKSMRGSDPDATVYWMAKMLEAGEDPLFIARRIVICAAEDVGNADPQALVVAVSALQAFEKIGLPEGRIPLSMAALYVATAPKSNAAYVAIDSAIEAVRNEPARNVPDHLRDTSYKSAKKLGAGAGYLYPHSFAGHYVKQAYLPDHKTFYTPSSEGLEKIIQERMKKRRETPDG